MFEYDFHEKDINIIIHNRRNLVIDAMSRAMSIKEIKESSMYSLIEQTRLDYICDIETSNLSELLNNFHNDSPSLLGFDTPEAALAIARCVYIILRQEIHGWIKPLDTLVQSGHIPFINPDLEKKSIKIPNNICQYWDNTIPPSDVLELISKWRKINNFSHTLIDDKQAQEFIQSYFGDRVLNAYCSVSHVAGKADLFRLAWLYQNGGIYVDADEELHGNIENIIPSDDSVVLSLCEGSPPCLTNNFITAPAFDPFIEHALKVVILRIENPQDEASAWLQTGPGAISMAFLDDWALDFDRKKTSSVQFIYDRILRKTSSAKEDLEYRKSKESNWKLGL
ncbi:glycosyltransferase family 32 protein [Neokomagataea anthophila]|uniref:Glycosyl transferase n=1 Tax=Neokomagataea anthophila TaxID=2826925 RepID=A0ABS5E9D6_9PROT|nr:glycosyltransferase [Neokomagataea anthophila]MBR0560519.1 hypothetical protein [Neokomagataea anthophila]